MIEDPDFKPEESPTALRRKREIAKAARAELMEKGVEGLRMRAVADRVGINVATLDYHVCGKEGLFALVAQSIVDDFKSQHMRTCRPDATGLDRLRQELVDFRTVRLNEPDIAPVLAVLWRRAASDPGIGRHVIPLREKWTARLIGVMQQGRDDGSLRPGLDPEAAARLFIWSLLGMGEPENLRDAYPGLAAELLRAFAADPTQDLQGQFE